MPLYLALLLCSIYIPVKSTWTSWGKFELSPQADGIGCTLIHGEKKWDFTDFDAAPPVDNSIEIRGTKWSNAVYTFSPGHPDAKHAPSFVNKHFFEIPLKRVVYALNEVIESFLVNREELPYFRIKGESFGLMLDVRKHYESEPDKPERPRSATTASEAPMKSMRSVVRKSPSEPTTESRLRSGTVGPMKSTRSMVTVLASDPATGSRTRSATQSAAEAADKPLKSAKTLLKAHSDYSNLNEYDYYNDDINYNEELEAMLDSMYSKGYKNGVKKGKSLRGKRLIRNKYHHHHISKGK